MMKDQSKKVIGLWLSLVVFITGLGLQVQVKMVHGASPYSFSDKETATKMTGTQYVFSGNSAVFFDIDSNQKQQVFYLNLTTGEKKQLTTNPGSKDGLAFNGDIAVWEDRRDIEPGSFNFNIYSYSLQTKKEMKLNQIPGEFVTPTIDNHSVVWYDRSSKMSIYVYDLVTMQVKLLGSGRYPILAQGKVLTQNANDNGLSLIDVATAEAHEIFKVSDSISVYSYAFNGKYAVWRQGNLDGSTNYRMMDVTDPTAKPINLTEPSVKKHEYRQITISNNEVAWMEDKQGVAQIMGAHLATNEAYSVTQGSTDQQLQSFQGDQLVMKSASGNLVYRNILHTEATPIGGGGGGGAGASSGAGGSSPSATTKPTNTPEPSTVNDVLQKQMDANGGQLSAEQGKVTLTVPQDAFSDKSLVSVSKLESLQVEYSKKLPTQKSFLSDPWEVKSQSEFLKPVELKLPYDSTKVNPQQLKKLGVFQYDEVSGQWRFISCLTNESAGVVTAQLKQPGTFAVMLNEISFADVKGHWAQQAIEISASRGIINGMSDDRFLPDAPLTRAQFTKILVSAMGIEPIETSGASAFTDIPANYWGTNWIKAATKAGLAQGDNGQFHPDALLTREQMFVMLIRALHAEDQVKALTKQETDRLLTAADKGQISEWARPYTALVLKLGLISGDAKGDITPTKSSTRAQAVIVTNRLLSSQKQL